MAGKDDIETRVAALGDLPREELAALWRKIFGCAPPKGVHKELFIRAAAFQMQERRFGELSGDAKRLLKAAMREAAETMPGPRSAAGVVTANIEVGARNYDTGRERAGRPIDVSGLAPTGNAAASAVLPKERQPVLPGARLIREWNGNSHVVDVVDDGFIYAGSRFKSLSKIAREITGTNWSGPRFFGL